MTSNAGLFALDRDDGMLLAFPSFDVVVVRCKGVDVRDGFWLFFADDGSPLEARFARPDMPADPAPLSHAFTLHRAMSGRWLQERIGQVKAIEGCGLSSPADLVETLKINRGKRVLQGGLRGQGGTG